MLLAAPLSYEGVPASPSLLIYPLTYDEDDQNGTNSLTRLGAGPHVTPDGFEGDGNTSRYKLSSVPTALASATATFSMAATITPYIANRHATRDTVVFAGNDDATANPKGEFCVLTAIGDGAAAQVGFRTHESGAVVTRFFCKWNWKYAVRFPVWLSGSDEVRPQTLLFLDANTLLVIGHYNDTESRCYKIDLTTGDVLGSFTFGTSTHRHVASIAQRGNGDVWVVDYETSHALKLDLAASFLAGTVSILADWDLSNMGSSVLTAIEFVTVSGTEYVLVGLYHATTTTFLYVIPVTQMVGGTTFALANRHKRFVYPREGQGFAIRSGDGLLYSSHNTTTGGGASTNDAPIYAFDISGQIGTLADGGTLVSLRAHFGPSAFPEDIKFHPSTGEAWVGTEGRAGVADNQGFAAYWRSPLVDNAAQANDYVAEYDGAGTWTFYINDVLFNTLTSTCDITPAALAIGGPPAASAGWSNGFCVATVKGVAFKSGRFTGTELAAIRAGSYEPNSLTVYTASLTNPGAESGAATGWTTETGGLGVRSATPSPRYEAGVTNTQYFTGGTSLATLSRQRTALTTITGLSTGALDTLTAAGNLWGRAFWRQSNFNGTDDGSTLGIRWLDGTPTQLSVTYGAVTPTGFNQIWRRRTLGVLADSGARNIDALQRMDRTAGTNNDGYHDDLVLKIYTR